MATQPAAQEEGLSMAGGTFGDEHTVHKPGGRRAVVVDRQLEPDQP